MSAQLLYVDRVCVHYFTTLCNYFYHRLMDILIFWHLLHFHHSGLFWVSYFQNVVSVLCVNFPSFHFDVKEFTN